MPDSPITSPVSGFSHVQLLCTDVSKSRAWYSTVLDADVLTESDDGTYVALRHKPSRIVVVLSERPSGFPGAGPLDHLAFAVPDGDALAVWAAHLTEQGIEHDGIVDELGKPSLPLRDPDGIAIELVAPPPSRSGVTADE
jgi:catechol-2,3-dioxygenase